MKVINLQPFKNKSSSKGAKEGFISTIPKEVIVATTRRSITSTAAGSEFDDGSIHHIVHLLDNSPSFNEIDIYADVDEEEERLEFMNWRRQKADMEEKLETLVEQAKRQDEMLHQMWTKLKKNRTIDAQLDKLEETLARLETTTMKNKQLEAENRQLKRMLRGRPPSLTTVSEAAVVKVEVA